MTEPEGVLMAEAVKQGRKAVKNLTTSELQTRYWEKMDDRERMGFNEDDEIVLVLVAAELGLRGASALC